MNVAQLRDLLSNPNAKILLLDVREKIEIDQEPYFAELPRNYINIPLCHDESVQLDTIAKQLNVKIADLGWTSEETRIITLCHSGRRSKMACDRLLGLNLHSENLEGGYVAWSQG